MRWIAIAVALLVMTGCSSAPGVATPGQTPLQHEVGHLTNADTTDLTDPTPVPDASDDPTDDEPGFTPWGTTTFDHHAVQQDVREILTSAPSAGFGLSEVGEVSCPEGVAVEAGGTFECTVTIGGAPKRVPITIQDNNGAYEVGHPVDVPPADGPSVEG